MQVWVIECESFYHQAVWSAGIEGLYVSRVYLFRRTITAEEADRLEHVLCEIWAVAYDGCNVLAQEIAAAGCYRCLVVDDCPRDWEEGFCTVRVQVNFIFDCRLC